jgi:hypothetical protein
MDDTNPNVQTEDGGTSVQHHMTLGKAWGLYLGAAALTGVCAQLQWWGALPWVYLGLGFVMTKIVMGGLIEWHPVHNTIGNVFSAKVWMFFLWPLQMFFLLTKLTVIRVL